MIYGLWSGGPSYAAGSIESDVERFETIAHAREALRARYESNGLARCHFDYVTKEPVSVYVPAVTMESEIWVWFSDPSMSADPYPDRVVSFGRRGGVRVAIA